MQELRQHLTDAETRRSPSKPEIFCGSAAALLQADSDCPVLTVVLGVTSTHISVFCAVRSEYLQLATTFSIGITVFLDLVHRPVLKKQNNTTFQKLDLFPSSGEGCDAMFGPLEKTNLNQWIIYLSVTTAI
jgi:hypothetical protein